MLYHLLYPLHTVFSVLNVFRYITFRTIYASLTAFFICFFLGPWVIEKLSRLQVGQYIREDGPKSHLGKAGTPTMGGVLIVGSIALSTLLWSDLSNPVRLDRPAGAGRVRSHRLHRRLPDADQETEQRAERARQAGAAGRPGPGRRGPGLRDPQFFHRGDRAVFQDTCPRTWGGATSSSPCWSSSGPRTPST